MNDLADRLAVTARDELLSLDGAGASVETTTPSATDHPVPWSVGPALLVVGTVTPSDAQRRSIRDAIRSLGPDSVVVSGLRRGTELLAAEEALTHRVPLAVVIPFADPAKHWGDSDRSRFDEAFARASYDIDLGGDPATPGTAVANRNRWFEGAAMGALVVGDDVLADRYEAAGMSVVRA